MAKKQVAQPLTHGTLVSLPGGRVGEWISEAEEGTSFRTEHFRTVDSLGLLMRNGAITAQKVAAGAIQTAKLGTDSVTAAAILNNSITAAKLAAAAPSMKVAGPYSTIRAISCARCDGSEASTETPNR